MVNNLFKHNSRSYFDVYNALVNAYPRKPTWMFNEMSGQFDFQSELMNRIATDILYPITRESAYAFAAKCDYTPVEADGATDTLTITLTSAKAKTLPIGYQVGGQSTATGKMVIYELTAVGNSGSTDTITVAAKQKKTVTSKLIGTVLNSDDYYDYPIDGYTNIIDDNTSTLTIDSQTWTQVDNFDASTSSSRHFMLIFQSSGKSRVRFGDGTYGMKPSIGSSIYMTFATTEGLGGRMEAGEITINVGQDADIASITNAGSTGGNDAESVNSIIRNARANVRFRDIVWSVEDLETSAYAASSSVIKAAGFAGIGSAAIHIIPSGGGTPGSTLCDTVETYVKARTQFGLMPVTVTGPSYVTTSIHAHYTLVSGFVEETVSALLFFAMILASTAIDSQVIDSYDEDGIVTCRGVINSLFAATITVNVPTFTAFTVAEDEALEAIILRWKSLLSTKSYREWGQDLEVGDLWIMGNDLVDYGVDNFNLVTPITNVSIDTDEIHDCGTITITKD
jgi:hypothetical protein